jgi:hypothetical protein
MADKVLAIEEVKKYARTVAFLARSFGLESRIEVRPLSLYDCNTPAFHDRFDIVFFPGVIYHLSDPVLALRILFNSLKTGGFILVESAGIDTDEPLCRFEGSRIYGKGDKSDLSRGGWNWFRPSPAAVGRMMREAGFEDVQSQWHAGSGRVYAYGCKRSQVGICKAGLSVRTIR